MYLKYPKIADCSDTEFIDRALKEHLLLTQEMYSVQEKLIGERIQFMLSAGGGFTLAMDSEIMDLRKATPEVIELVTGKFSRLFSDLRKNCARTHCEVNLFGILVTPGLGPPQYPVPEIRFIDIAIDTHLIPFSQAYKMLAEYSPTFPSYLTPVFRLARSLEEALDFNPKMDSMLSDQEGILAGGVIIKPYNRMVLLADGTPFWLQWENDLTPTPAPEADPDEEPRDEESE